MNYEEEWDEEALEAMAVQWMTKMHPWSDTH